MIEAIEIESAATGARRRKAPLSGRTPKRTARAFDIIGKHEAFFLINVNFLTDQIDLLYPRLS